tara:strand:- start:54029 stop:54424 length:396 start_codon:yes stop_codon:yes gene_type:complete
MRAALSAIHREGEAEAGDQNEDDCKTVELARHTSEQNQIPPRARPGDERSACPAGALSAANSREIKHSKTSAFLFHMLQAVHNTGFQTRIGHIGLLLLIVFRFGFAGFFAGAFLAFGHGVTLQEGQSPSGR